MKTKATHVLDPTLLLDKSVYLNFLQDEINTNNEGELYYYCLDKTRDENKFIENVASLLGTKTFTAYPKETIKNTRFIDDIHNYIYPSIIEWLRGFHKATLSLQILFMERHSQ